MPWWPEQKREHAARHVSSSLQELCSCITEGMEEGALTPYLRLAPLPGGHSCRLGCLNTVGPI